MLNFISKLSLMLVIVLQIGYSRPNSNIELVTQISYEGWSNCRAVAAEGEIVYVLQEELGVRIVDTTDPNWPRQVGLFEYDDLTWDIAIKNDILIISLGRQGLIFVNVSNPANPRQISQIRGLEDARNITLAEDYAFVSSGYDGVYMIDVRIPQIAHVVSRIDTDGFAVKTAYYGGYLYIADREGGLQVYNLLNPENPQWAGSLASTEIRDVVIDEGWAYIAEVDTISRIRIDDNINMVRVSSWRSNSTVLSLLLNDGYIYCIQSQHRVSILTFTDRISEVNYFDLSCSDMAIAGDYLHLTSTNGLFNLVDISTPEEAVSIAIVGRDCYTQNIERLGDYVVLGSFQSGLLNYCISNPLSPSPVWFENPQSSTFVDDILTVDTLLLDISRSPFDRFLRIWSISDPSNVRQLSSTRLSGSGSNFSMAVDGRYLCYSSSYSSYVMNISNPSEPRQLALLATFDGDTKDILIKDNYALIAGVENVMTVDFSDPRYSRIVGRYSPQGSVKEMEIFHDSLLVMTSNGGLEIADMSDPVEIRFVAEYPLNFDGQGLSIEGQTAYVSGGSHGIFIFNLSQPETPELIGWYDTDGSCMDIETYGHYAFVADGDYFGIYDCSQALSIPSSVSILHPSAFILSTYPNPFNSSTTIEYRVGANSNSPVRLSLYDLSGRLVQTMVEGRLIPGIYRTTLNANGFASGTYMIWLYREGQTSVMQVEIIR